MINLKLAEYREGKFLGFLMLGDDFLFGRDFIDLTKISVEPLTNLTNQDKFERIMPKVTVETGIHHLDETDPLKRFDGLFDGRTYGRGRFILMQEICLDGKIISDDDIIEIVGQGNVLIDTIECMQPDLVNYCVEGDLGGILGNLHKNPELWNKIENSS